MSDNLLLRAHLKETPGRRAILRVLRAADGPQSAQEIWERCGDSRVNLSTVYRFLGLLCKSGLLVRTARQDGAVDYQLTGGRHHHQLVCALCGEEVPLEGCPLGAMAKELEVRTGFAVTGHSLQFTGICPRCQKKRSD